jgi:hypothetical protein
MLELETVGTMPPQSTSITPGAISIPKPGSITCGRGIMIRSPAGLLRKILSTSPVVKPIIMFM